MRAFTFHVPDGRVSNPFAHCVVFALAVLMSVPAAAAPQKLVKDHETGQPAVTLRYSCDATRGSELGTRVIVPDELAFVVKAEPAEVVYFTVDALFTNDADEIVHTRMHFVLGAEGETPARALVNGRGRNGNDTGSLITLQNGWMWVSDSPPPNWSGELEPPDLGALAPPERGVTTQPVSWSITSLLHAWHTYSGADMTEFIFSVEEDLQGGVNHKAAVYVRAQGENALHRRGSVKRTVGANEMSAAVGDSDPGAVDPINNGTADKRLVLTVECRVKEIRAVPVGSSECADRAASCACAIEGRDDADDRDGDD